MGEGLPGYELDQEIDDHAFVTDTPVYCPVPWCNAHNLRFAACGDADGDYDGIHVARVRYVPRAAELVEQQLRSIEEGGQSRESAELTLSLLCLHQDSIDMGSIPKGRRGRRWLTPRPTKGEDR